MSTLSSSSTLVQVVAAYLDNAGYDEDGNAAQAKAFITACRHLLQRRATVVKHAGEEVEINLELIQKQLEEARQWLASNDTSATASGAGAVRHYDFQDFRS